jgi:hypothetical protein
MPQIVTIAYFQKANDLNIPLGTANAVANPTLATPNSTNALTLLCTRVEKSLLLNALGLTTYNELQLALADIDNPLYASYKKLVEGDEYDGKVWNGLEYDYSLIAYRIYEMFVTETNERLTSVGNTQGNPEKSTLVSPKYKIANANANFISQYQGGYLNEPIVYDLPNGQFIDWFGIDNDVNVSLYRYLTDKLTDFPGLDLSNFKVYDTQNSFGI